MKVLVFIIPLLLALLCRTGSADECGNTCKYTEQCLKNGTCVDRSKLVDCGFYHCLEGQKCCDWGCMPDNKVCCSHFYCDWEHTCCGVLFCCKPGTYCDDGECKLCYGGDCSIYNPTTKRVQTTPKPFTTKSIRTTQKPFTTKPKRTTPGYVKTTPRKQTTRAYRQKSSSKSQFLWWHGIIIAAVVIIAIVLIGLYLWHRRTTGSHGSNGGKVLSLPPQSIGSAHTITANTGISPHNLQTGNIAVGYTENGTRANFLPQTQQHLVVTKTGVPPYIIHTGYSSDGNKNANVHGQSGHVSVNSMHQIEKNIVERPQNHPHVKANGGKTKTKTVLNGKPLPHL